MFAVFSPASGVMHLAALNNKAARSVIMPQITLPDGSIKSFDHPVSVMEVAQTIGAGLAKATIAGKVKG